MKIFLLALILSAAAWADKPAGTVEDKLCPFLRGQGQPKVKEILSGTVDALNAAAKKCPVLTTGVEKLKSALTNLETKTDLNAASSAHGVQAMAEVKNSLDELLSAVTGCPPETQASVMSSTFSLLHGVSALEPSIGLASAGIVAGGELMRFTLNKFSGLTSALGQAESFANETSFNNLACLYVAAQAETIGCAQGGLTDKLRQKQAERDAMMGNWKGGEHAAYRARKRFYEGLGPRGSGALVEEWFRQAQAIENPQSEAGQAALRKLDTLLKQDAYNPSGNGHQTENLRTILEAEAQNLINHLGSQNRASAEQVQAKDAAERFLLLLKNYDGYLDPMLDENARGEQEREIWKNIKGRGESKSPLSLSLFLRQILGPFSKAIELDEEIKSLQKRKEESAKDQSQAQATLNASLAALTKRFSKDFAKKLKEKSSAHGPKLLQPADPGDRENYFSSHALPLFRTCALLAGTLHLDGKSANPTHAKIKLSSEYESACAAFFCPENPDEALIFRYDGKTTPADFRSQQCFLATKYDLLEEQLHKNMLAFGVPCPPPAQPRAGGEKKSLLHQLNPLNLLKKTK